MIIPTKVQKQYIRSGPRLITESLHITVGETFTIQKGDIIVLYPKKSGKIEIKKAPVHVIRDFRPYYVET